MEDHIHGDSTIVGPSVVPKLQILRGDSPGKTHRLKFKTRIGRESDNDIVIVDPRISRYHFQISFEEGEWLLSDLGSVNGTYINGMLVNIPQALAHGDQIKLGETILVYRDPTVEKDTPFDPSATVHGHTAPPYGEYYAISVDASQPDVTAVNRKRLAWIAGGLILILVLALTGLILWLNRDLKTSAIPLATSTQAFTILRTTPKPEANLTLKYEDDFSDSFGGWDDAFGKNYTKQYGNNKYHIEITTNNLVVWGLANRAAGDFEVEVEATKEDGGNPNTYGLIFRHVDHDNYYRFDISSDGFFLLSKFQEGAWHTLVDWSSSSAINQGQTTLNVLKVSANGPEIAIFANSEELARVTDTAFAQGNFGFFASTFEDPHIWVSFDNFKLWAPPEQEIVLIPPPAPYQTPTPHPPTESTTPELPTTPTIAVEQVVVITPTSAPTDTPISAAQAAVAPTPLANEAAETSEIITNTVEAVEESIPELVEVSKIAAAPTSVSQQLPEFVSRDQPLARGEAALSGKLYFPIYDPDRGVYDIFRANPNGADRELVQTEASQVAVNAAGDTIAYRSWKPDQRGLISRRLNATDYWLFVQFFEAASPVFSADEQFFVFHSRQGGQIPAIYRTVGAEHEVLRREGAPIQGQMADLGPDNRVVYRGCIGNSCGIISSNLDGSFPQLLTTLADDTAPSISPDGKAVAFMSNRDGNWEIYTIGSDGRNLQRLTDDPGNDGLPTWSPDGKLLAFVTNRDGEWAIWDMQPDGRQKRQLFPLNGSIDGIVQVDVAHAFGWLEERIVWSK